MYMSALYAIGKSGVGQISKLARKPTACVNSGLPATLLPTDFTDGCSEKLLGDALGGPFVSYTKLLGFLISACQICNGRCAQAPSLLRALLLPVPVGLAIVGFQSTSKLRLPELLLYIASICRGEV